MRKFLIAAAVATSAIAVASPAVAQYYPAQGNGYGNNYGQYHGQVRSYLVRLDQLQRQISQLDQRNRLTNREARDLHNQARWLQQRVQQSGRNGLNNRERRDVEVGINRLQQRIRYELTDQYRGNRGDDRWEVARRNGWTDYDGDGVWDHEDRFVDHDRDGRDDRQERRRGW